MEGYVYILVNKAMPNYTKIGYTYCIEQRIDQLYNTSTPHPFELYFAKRFPKKERAKEIEKELHRKFQLYRINPNREFFTNNVAEISNALAETQSLPECGTSIPISPEAFEMEMLFQRGISYGSRLVFAKDTSIKAEVGKQYIFYENIPYTLMGLTSMLTGKKNLRYKEILRYWLWNGEKIAHLKKSIRDRC